MAVKKRLNDTTICNELVARLVRDYPFEQITEHLNAIKLYREVAFTPHEQRTEGQLQELYYRTIKTCLIPAATLLLHEALLPDGKALISAARMIDLLSLNDASFGNTCQMQGLCMNSGDMGTGLGMRDLLPEKVTPAQQMVWILQETYHGRERHPLLSKESELNSDTLKHIYWLLSPAIMVFREGKEGAKKSVGQLLHDTRSGHDTYLLESGKIQSADHFKLLTPLNISKGHNRVLSSIKINNKELTSYPKSVTLVSMGLHFLYQYLEGKSSPLDCPKHYLEAAKLGHFPKLFREAADLYMGFGRYDEAIECL